MSGALEENKWKWAPILILSPLPWAVIAVVIVLGGQIVIAGPPLSCISALGEPVDTSLLLNGMGFAITVSYIFLMVVSWTWLGHSVSVKLPILSNQKWIWRTTRVLRPFRTLKELVAAYGLLGIFSLIAASIVSAATAAAAPKCATQIPLTLAFSTFIIIVYWVAFGLSAGRLCAITFGAKILTQSYKRNEKDNGTSPKTDEDMVGVIFKKFDPNDEGRIPIEKFPAMLSLLGMSLQRKEIDDAVVSFFFFGDASRRDERRKSYVSLSLPNKYVLTFLFCFVRTSNWVAFFFKGRTGPFRQRIHTRSRF